ncbi:MAG TPA: phytanoyl-CoA dioxygenase family protein, partial [Chitinophagales bacterium]|nr:phytanoyl-CoA dioxygenase family protein [Chitinophagales bacterium]
MKRKVFRDPVLQKQFEENSYCVVDLFTPEEVERLKEIYFDNRISEQNALEVTLKNANFEQNKKIKNLSAAVALPRVKEVLLDYRMLHSGFLAKIPGHYNEIKLHQDSGFTDETKYQALNVWCPLTDVDENNGAVWIVKHSDKFFSGIRGQPFKEYDCTDISKQVAGKLGAMVKMKAGQGLIYDVRLFHYSWQNTTSDIRVAGNLIMIPEEAIAYYYHFNKAEGVIEKYEIDDDFMMRYFTEYLPTGNIKAKLAERIATKGAKKVSYEEFEKKYHEYNSPPKRKVSDYIARALGFN